MTDTIQDELTEAERLLQQREELFRIMKEAFGETSERFLKLQEMYDQYGNRLLEAPASGKVHYHNAYAGGYIDHILHVYNNAMMMAKALKTAGGLTDFTKSEVAMAAIHHDLWKLGIPNGEPYYIEQTSDWHRKNKGEIFKHNDKLPFMNVTDGAIYILQKQGIPLTHNEFLAIKLSDGLYDESNASYLKNHGKFPIHSNLPYIIHWADHMSTTAERDPLKQEFLTTP